MIMKQIKLFLFFLFSIAWLSANSVEFPDEGIHNKKAPLYWSVYEYLWQQDQNGVAGLDMDINANQWDEYINWFVENLKPYGYDMICTDGWLRMSNNNGALFMTDYGSVSLKSLAAKCNYYGIKLGIYDNPLWIRSDDNTIIPGTDKTVGSLRYDSSKDVVCHPDVANDTWFKWAVASHDGCREYIDEYFRHYSSMGVTYVRIDFLSWYENGEDRGMGTVGRGYGRENYQLALQYIKESASKYGVFVSLVMPHCFNDAELESEYGHMFRIDADTYYGGWNHFSENSRNKKYDNWPCFDNMFDGFVYWSRIAGRGRVIMDGDFTRLNTFANAEQKKSVISLQLMAGGPIAVADQPTTIGDNVQFYQNEELLALNADRFAGKPLSSELGNKKNQIWYGQMTNGDWVVGFFNRDATEISFAGDFAEMGIEGYYTARDLWTHSENTVPSKSYSVTLPAYGCKILRLSKNKITPNPSIFIVGSAAPCGWTSDNKAPIALTRIDESTFEYRGYLTAGEFKFHTEKGSYNTPRINAVNQGDEVTKQGFTDYQIMFPTYDNKWKVTDAGYYVLTLDIARHTLSARYCGDTFQSMLPFGDIYIIGWAANQNWDDVSRWKKLTYKGDNVYEYKGRLTGGTDGEQFRFSTYTCDLSTLSFKPSASAHVNLSSAGFDETGVSYCQNPDANWRVTDAGYYTLTLYLNELSVASKDYLASLPVAATAVAENGSNEYYATFSNLYSDMELSAADGSAIEVYNVTVANDKLVLSERENAKVACGEGVLLKASTPNISVTALSGTSLTPAQYEQNFLIATPISESSVACSNDFRLYRLTFDNTENKSGLGFYYGDAAGTTVMTEPNKAYLKVPVSQGAAQIKGFSFDLHPTKVDAVHVEQADKNEELYDLSGRRVVTPASGIYIKGNSKLIIK